MTIEAGQAEAAFARIVKDLEANRFPGIERPMSETFSDGVRYNFDNATEPNGTPWKPRKDNLPHPLLLKTGAMETEATNAPVEVQGSMVTWKMILSVVFYGWYQQKGTRNADGSERMPARPYFGLGVVYRARMRATITKFIRAKIIRRR